MDKGQEPYYETIPLSAFLCGLVHYAWLYNILRYEQPPIDASIETLPLLWSGPTGIFRPAEKKNAANFPPIFCDFQHFSKNHLHRPPNGPQASYAITSLYNIKVSVSRVKNRSILINLFN